MKKCTVIVIFVLLNWITICTSCSGNNWEECPKFRKKKPLKTWCNCNTDDNNKPKPKPDTNDITVHDETVDESCEPYNPPMPDYSRPGQRISTTKCYEYVWQHKVRVEQAEREKKCNNSKQRNHVFKREINTNLSLEAIFSVPVVPRPTTLKFIVGGYNASPAEFPHMGAVGWNSSEPNRDWKFMCGSTLISPKFALTAAHCTSANPRDTTISDIVPKIVRFGAERIISGPYNVDRYIFKIFENPKHRAPLKYNDIALFEFEVPITFNKFVQPACLWTKDMKKIKGGTVTGWGVLNPDEHDGHPYLQVASLDVMDSNRCDELLYPYRNRRWNGVEDHQFCAGQMAGGVDACQGDSGGPFQMKIPLPPQVARREGNMHYIVGVTSFGVGCGKRDVPGIYTKVSYFLDWIEPIVWE